MVADVGPRTISNQTRYPIAVYGSGLSAGMQLALEEPFSRSFPLVVLDSGHAFARLPSDLDLPPAQSEATTRLALVDTQGKRHPSSARLTIINDKGFPDLSQMIALQSSPALVVLSKPTDSLFLVDREAGSVKTLPTDDGPSALASFTDAAQHEWIVVAHEFSGTLLLFDAARPEDPPRRLPAPRGVSALAVDSPTRSAIVAEHISDTLAALDLTQGGRLLWRSPVAPNPRAIALVAQSPPAVAVASMQTGEVELFDRASGKRQATLVPHRETPILGGHTEAYSRFIMGPGIPRDLVWSPSLGRLLLTSTGPNIGPNPDRMEVSQNGGVDVLDAGNHPRYVRHLGFDAGLPEKLLVDETRHLLYVADPAIGVVRVLDLAKILGPPEVAERSLVVDIPILPPDGFPTARPKEDFGITPAGARRRAGVELHSGPTGLALSADGGRLYVLNRFTGTQSTLDVTGIRSKKWRLLRQVQVTETLSQRQRRLGQILYFADVGRSAMSCEACHPGGHTGGLMFAKTHPMRIYRASSILGCRDTPPYFNPPSSPTLRATASFVGGRNRFHNPDPSPAEVEALAYFSSTFVTPPNPFAGQDGEPPAALALPDHGTGDPRRGRTFFERQCVSCHPPPLFALDQDEATRAMLQSVGTPALFPLRTELQEPGLQTFPPPSLLGVWDEFPLFNTGSLGYTVLADQTVGRAPEPPLRLVVEHPHGGAQPLAGQQADDLFAYLLTL
jgi:hypothetical protein